jgi:hypothetical protein
MRLFHQWKKALLIQIQGKKRNLMYLKIFLCFRERQVREKMELLQNDLKQCKDKNKLEQLRSNDTVRIRTVYLAQKYAP